RSASEYTATEAMLISFSVRMTRIAISPRLATRTFSNMRRESSGASCDVPRAYAARRWRSVSPIQITWSRPGPTPTSLIGTAAFPDVGAELVVELGRERAGANASGVRLRDSPDLVDVGRAHAGAHAGCTGDRVRRGDERVGPVVQVEQRSLGALEDHRATGVE